MPDIFVSPDKEEKPVKTTEDPTPDNKDEPPAKQEEEEFPDGDPVLESVPHKHGRVMSSFTLYPKHANFFDKDPDEKVILIVRRHPITNIKWIVISVFMLILPFVLNGFSVFSFLPYKFYFAAILGWYLLTLAFVFENFLSWFFNVNIVTNKRVIDVDFVNLVYREVSDAEFGQIQDVTVKVGSVIRTLFDFGDIFIQTAAEIPEIEFEAIPHPDRVDKILRELRNQATRRLEEK